MLAGRRSVSLVRPWLECSLTDPADDGVAKCTGDNSGVHVEGQAYMGTIDSVFLFAYAFGMFFRYHPAARTTSHLTACSGHLAERSDLRLFLTGGILGLRLIQHVLAFTLHRQRRALHPLWPLLLPGDPCPVVLRCQPGAPSALLSFVPYLTTAQAIWGLYQVR